MRIFYAVCNSLLFLLENPGVYISLSILLAMIGIAYSFDQFGASVTTQLLQTLATHHQFAGIAILNLFLAIIVVFYRSMYFLFFGPQVTSIGERKKLQERLTNYFGFKYVLIVAVLDAGFLDICMWTVWFGMLAMLQTLLLHGHYRSEFLLNSGCETTAQVVRPASHLIMVAALIVTLSWTWLRYFWAPGHWSFDLLILYDVTSLWIDWTRNGFLYSACFPQYAKESKLIASFDGVEEFSYCINRVADIAQHLLRLFHYGHVFMLQSNALSLSGVLLLLNTNTTVTLLSRKMSEIASVLQNQLDFDARFPDGSVSVMDMTDSNNAILSNQSSTSTKTNISACSSIDAAECHHHDASLSKPSGTGTCTAVVEDFCAICLSDLMSMDKLKMLPCSHLLHRQCLLRLLRQSTECKLIHISPPTPSSSAATSSTATTTATTTTTTVAMTSETTVSSSLLPPPPLAEAAPIASNRSAHSLSMGYYCFLGFYDWVTYAENLLNRMIVFLLGSGARLLSLDGNNQINERRNINRPNNSFDTNGSGSSSIEKCFYIKCPICRKETNIRTGKLIVEKSVTTSSSPVVPPSPVIVQRSTSSSSLSPLDMSTNNNTNSGHRNETVEDGNMPVGLSLRLSSFASPSTASLSSLLVSPFSPNRANYHRDALIQLQEMFPDHRLDNIRELYRRTSGNMDVCIQELLDNNVPF